MWRILQHDVSDDFVVATGQSHSVREFCEMAFKECSMEISWQGSGVDESAVLVSVAPSAGPPDIRESPGPPSPGAVVIRIDPRYFRPTEVDFLLGDPAKARRMLGWEPSVSFRELVRIMVQADVQALLELRRCQDIIQRLINRGARVESGESRER
jgi:GDPmannose 4,6-dehydratase